MLVLALLVFGALVTACGGPAGTAEPTKAPTAVAAPTKAATTAPEPTKAPTAPAGPRKGGQITIGSIQEPNVLNPFWTNLTVAQEAYTLVLDSFVKINEKGELMPFLASAVPSRENGGISADGLTYTFKLRKEAKWHDGKPITSADAKFTWETVMNPKNNVVQRTPAFTGVASVETPDENTVVFKLKEPQAPWLLAWSGVPLLPKHVLDGQDLNTAKWNTAPTVGSGPFVFVEWVSGSHILVKKNPNYYLGEPYLDQIVYRIMPDSNVLLAAMEKGDVDMRYAITAEQVLILDKRPEWKVFRTPAYSIFHFTINNSHPLMSDKRVRQALTYALDKKGITQTILKGLVEPAWSPVTVASADFHNPNVTKFQYDPNKAKQVLDEAGWKVNSATGVREKDGKKLAFEIVNISGDVERLQIVEVAQRQWKEVGVSAEIKPVDAATFVKTMQSGDFAIAYGFWGGGPDPDSILTTWWYSKMNNWQRMQLPELDKLIEQGRTTLDKNQRKEIYNKIQELIAQEATNLFVYARVFFDGAKNKVHNFKPVAGGGVNTWNTHEWWIEP
jgi:peptide/nickel transport system substrate-binding protein